MCLEIHLHCSFLGPRGPHGIPSLVSPSVRPLVRPQEKFGSHIYRLICLMNHLKTHQTSLMAPWDPLNAPLDPLGPPGPPPSTPNDSKTGLLSSLNSSDHLACFSNHQMTHQMSLLILWDISPLPLWSVYHQDLRP